MTHEYSPHGLYALPILPNRCKASVPDGMRFYQCSRKPWNDGWCKQHHPDTEAARRAESKARYQRRHAQSTSSRLRKAHEEIDRLRARIAELEAEREQT